MHHSQHPFPRSVHNSQIERIWYDISEGFGGKWKDMFIDLEANYGLDVNNAAHIWLLHHLFLNTINEDATSWTEAWNNHKLKICGEPQQTPVTFGFQRNLDVAEERKGRAEAGLAVVIDYQ